MNKLKIVLLTVIFVAGAFTFNSCRTNEKIDPNIDIPGLGGYEYARTPLDDWLDQTYLYPYNIKVYYHWDAVLAYTDLSAKLVPVQLDKVQPMMDALARVWFTPFLYAASPDFLRKYTPKTVILVGSPQYSADGSSVMLGQAEGPSIILLTNTNAFVPSSAELLRSYLHVIEHEFVHTLAQNAPMPTTYKAVTTPFYDPTGWTNYTVVQANQLGFITPYAMTSPDEDFAEIVSMVMVYGFDYFQNTVLQNAAASPVYAYAVQALQMKLSIAADYYMKNYNINLYDDPNTGKSGLINLVQQAVEDVVVSYQ